MGGTLPELVGAWLHALPRSLPAMLALGLLGASLWGRTSRRWMLLVPMVWALGAAIRRAALFDDAWISFRYARNFAEGHGLVWNVGERVEGYTNFLWTLLLGVLHATTPWDAPRWALVLCLLIMLANLALAWRLARELGGPAAGLLAAAVLALWAPFTDFGTSGMETGLAALWVTATGGAVQAKRPGLAGLFAALGTLTRPDLALLFPAAAVALFAVRSQRSWRRLLSMAAPGLLVIAHVAWRWHYYGDVVPNTFHAKAGGGAWWSQGTIYLTAFGLVDGGFVLGGLAAWWALRTRSGLARFLGFGGALWTLYVVRVGGDFMVSRSFVPWLPLIAVGVEGAAARVRWPALAVALALAATVRPAVFPEGTQRWGLADESSYYPLVSWDTLETNHRRDRLGRLFGRELADRGIPIVLGVGGIGLLGYHSRLKLVDTLGLTEPAIAKQPLGPVRGRPGHEKQAPPGYAIERGVHFLRAAAGQEGQHPERFRRVVEIQIEHQPARRWWMIARYDRALMRRVHDEAEGIQFQLFPAWLDAYTQELCRRGGEAAQVREDLEWFDAYYFDHNRDRRRRRRLVRWLKDGRCG